MTDMWSREHDDDDGDDGDALMMVIMMILCRLRMRSGGRQLYMVDPHKKMGVYQSNIMRAIEHDGHVVTRARR